VTAARYWVERGDFEKGLGTFAHRKRPAEPGAWVEVELALVPAERERHGEEDASGGKSEARGFGG